LFSDGLEANIEIQTGFTFRLAAHQKSKTALVIVSHFCLKTIKNSLFWSVVHQKSKTV
jgi:hypothetical protein